MSKNLGKGFLGALKETYKAYRKYGARSPKKLVPIHSWFAKEIVSGLDKNYSVRSFGYDGEYTVEGKYYLKRVDITIFNAGKPVTTVSLKFVMSNYKQNSNNYFEQLLGETANIKRAKIGLAHYLVLQFHTPYKNKSGKEKKEKEILSERYIKKYVKLFEDQNFSHKPDVLGMAIIDIKNKSNPYFVDLSKLELDKNTADILRKEFSIKIFIKKVVALCK